MDMRIDPPRAAMLLLVGFVVILISVEVIGLITVPEGRLSILSQIIIALSTAQEVGRTLRGRKDSGSDDGDADGSADEAE